MEQNLSALLGIVGGIVDIAVGLLLIQPSPPVEPMGMRSTMVATPNPWPGYFLLVLGTLVLMTGLYLMTVRMMRRRSSFGLLMLVYGVIMLILGVAMLGHLFFMMQGSTLSGFTMVTLAAAMIYSGSTMGKG